MSIKEINGQEITNKEIAEYLKAIVICKQTGEYLVDIILDSDINPVLLSSFVAALSLFGADSLGKIEEISVKGLDVEMIIWNPFSLVIIWPINMEWIQSLWVGLFHGLWKLGMKVSLQLKTLVA